MQLVVLVNLASALAVFDDVLHARECELFPSCVVKL